MDLALPTRKKRTSSQDPKDIATCPRCDAMVATQCVSIELRKRNRGKVLARAHRERYAAAKALVLSKAPKTPSTKSTRKRATKKSAPLLEPTITNVAEVLELGSLCNGFSPVPLLIGGHVVEVPMTEVFGIAELVAPTLLHPPTSISTLTPSHHRSFMARVRLGDVEARSEYLSLFNSEVGELVTVAMAELGDVVVEDVRSEAKFLLWDQLRHWDEDGRGAIHVFANKCVKHVARRLVGKIKARANLFDVVDTKVHNVFDVMKVGMGSKACPFPLVYMGKVVDVPVEKTVDMARVIGATLHLEVKSYKELTLEHDCSYTTRFSLGDVGAGWEYIHLNHPLVVKLVKKAKRFLPPNDLDMEDLVNEGVCGAWEGFRRWDPTLGKFSTYVNMWIVQHLQAKAARGGAGIAVRPELHLALFKAKEDGRELSNTEAALDRVRVLSSIDETTTNKEGKVGANVVRALTSEQDVFADVANADAKQKLSESLHIALDVLNERERSIIVSRMFGSGDEQLTLEDIGAKLGISRERVRQIEGTAKRKLRDAVSRQFGGTDNVLAALGG